MHQVNCENVSFRVFIEEGIWALSMLHQGQCETCMKTMSIKHVELRTLFWWQYGMLHMILNYVIISFSLVGLSLAIWVLQILGSSLCFVDKEVMGMLFPLYSPLLELWVDCHGLKETWKCGCREWVGVRIWAKVLMPYNRNFAMII